MERLVQRRPSGINRKTLRSWGFIFLAASVIGRSTIQNYILGMNSLTTQQLLEVMQSSQAAMNYATAALVLEVLGTCAIPIFAFLLAEGARNTGNFSNYLTRVTKIAVVSEIPYNFAMSGKLVDITRQNPSFGLLLALILIYFYQRYAKKKVKDILICLIVTIAAVLWCFMLRIENGAILVLLAALFWLLWSKPSVRNMAGAGLVLLGSITNLFLMAAPMAFLAIHFYNGEQGEENRRVNYLAYPVLLMVAAIAGMFLF